MIAMDDLFIEAGELFEYTRMLRRDFHRNPELGFHEVRTSGIIARELNQFGISIKTGLAQTGVMALIEGDLPGPVVLLRFDMDALPIDEETGVEYASINPGVMHACGHDGHMAVGITVARILQDHHKDLHGMVKIIFQPAEEGLGGAERMIAEGVLKDPVPDYALAFHLWNERPAGWLGIPEGPLMAGADMFTVKISGRGGHGALPQLTIDPIVTAAQITSALQSIVARNVSPLQSAVVSVTRIQAGEVFNIIPQTVEMVGTLRTFEPEVRQEVQRHFNQIVAGVAAGFGCEASVDIQLLTPAVMNDSEVAKTVQAVARKLWPEIQIDRQYKSMVSEDMAFIIEKIPGCYVLVGSANAEHGLNFGHHHPRFNFDENVLPYATALMAAATIALSSKS
jgi:amidohydrolase